MTIKTIPTSVDPVVDHIMHFKIYLKPKVTLHCYYIYHFWVLVSGILNVLNSYLTSINYSYDS